MNKTRKVHEIKNKKLLNELEYKLGRILSFENNKPNYFRQHITDIKTYLLEELRQEELQFREENTEEQIQESEQ